MNEAPSRDAHYLRFKYTFAWLALSKPDTIMPLLQSEDAAPAIRNLWDMAGKDLPEASQVPSETVAASSDTAGTESVHLIQLPEPQAMGETYFMGVVPQQFGNPTRVYALEYSLNLMPQSAFGMLTQLDLEGRTTYGPTAEITLKSFLEGITRVASGNAPAFSRTAVPIKPMFSP